MISFSKAGKRNFFMLASLSISMAKQANHLHIVPKNDKEMMQPNITKIWTNDDSDDNGSQRKLEGGCAICDSNLWEGTCSNGYQETSLWGDYSIYGYDIDCYRLCCASVSDDCCEAVDDEVPSCNTCSTNLWEGTCGTGYQKTSSWGDYYTADGCVERCCASESDSCCEPVDDENVQCNTCYSILFEDNCDSGYQKTSLWGDYAGKERCCAESFSLCCEDGEGGGGGGGGSDELVYGLQPSCHSSDDSRYNICLDLVSTSGYYEDWMDTYGEAKTMWESVVVGNLAPFDTKSFDTKYPSEYACTDFPDPIDDLYICAKSEDIDGPGNILGMALPTFARKEGSNPNGVDGVYWRTSAGYMVFDSADIPGMISDGTFNHVITHEMGHIIGMGTLWEYNGVYTKGSGVYRDNTHAQEEWTLIGCTGALPVELEGGDGTADGHWDEECLQDELMTGYSSGAHPLSKMTIGTFEDMTYEVDYSQADAYTLNDLNSSGCGTSCPAANGYLRSSTVC